MNELADDPVARSRNHAARRRAATWHHTAPGGNGRGWNMYMWSFVYFHALLGRSRLYDTTCALAQPQAHTGAHAAARHARHGATQLAGCAAAET